MWNFGKKVKLLNVRWLPLGQMKYSLKLCKHDLYCISIGQHWSKEYQTSHGNKEIKSSIQRLPIGLLQSDYTKIISKSFVLLILFIVQNLCEFSISNHLVKELDQRAYLCPAWQVRFKGKSFVKLYFFLVNCSIWFYF